MYSIAFNNEQKRCFTKLDKKNLKTIVFKNIINNIFIMYVVVFY